ncbi:hypothetical protein P280DRAFT_51851 [Massarina eburnea CBS 473.64]|uniref:Uncharacterized protein n=1 Tax=Massarina eburnea CBS 473.64 TaxID=1395130 RepID=A0A6A6RZM7_9PLEO|nr:hypothetical protein P280DRAFT_51851 [Massarina eburnea CBS 473.64]
MKKGWGFLCYDAVCGGIHMVSLCLLFAVSYLLKSRPCKASWHRQSTKNSGYCACLIDWALSHALQPCLLGGRGMVVELCDPQR